MPNLYSLCGRVPSKLLEHGDLLRPAGFSFFSFPRHSLHHQNSRHNVKHPVKTRKISRKI